MPAFPPPRPAGFTLVELTVVLLVLAIGSAMVVPLFNGNEVTQLRTAAQLLAADLDAAKAESLTHADDPRVVVFDLTNHIYQIAPSSTPATAITNVYDKKPYIVQFGKGRASALPDVTISSVDLNGDNQLGFGIYGQLDQAVPATITLAADGATVTLTIDPATGEATIGDIQ
ncbi:MAG: prepilin-type N-terminal cleavage/methylation domain-containing protein [Planctomycetota bacterium]